jgi:excisionase family DNA binding protein
MERQSVRPAADATLGFLADVIAEQVAIRVKAELAAQGASRVQAVLLSVKDAAIYLGRSEQSVQRLIFDRAVPVVRVGRRVHLDRRDLDLWIEKNKY